MGGERRRALDLAELRARAVRMVREHEGCHARHDPRLSAPRRIPGPG